MNLAPLDWTVFGVFLGIMLILALVTKKYTNSVSDFLCGNRLAGRYLIAVARGMSGVGAITLIAAFEMFGEVGLTGFWWRLMLAPASAIIVISGWVIYRQRATRALTISQFFELRYSRRFRLFCGFIIFLSGVINFGIFPSVGSRFVMYYCGFPEYFNIGGVTISTYAVIMFTLLGTAVFITLWGGQIAVMVTDFYQGVIFLYCFLIIVVYLLWKIGLNEMLVSISTIEVENGVSLINPMNSTKAQNFGITFFLILLFDKFYNWMSWQGGSGYTAAAKTPHEARMGNIVGGLRNDLNNAGIALLSAGALVVLYHPDFRGIATEVWSYLADISNEEVRRQMTVPMGLMGILPNGLVGAFMVVIFAAFISTNDTYIHSWASIFIQDVVMPFRKKPFTRKQHMMLLKASVLGVAAFAFFFSYFFKQTQRIYMYQSITGAIWMSGAGSIIIGGLYWKKGTTKAAWATIITGSILGVSGWVAKELMQEALPFTGMELFFFISVTCICIYVIVSLIDNKTFNMDRMLHRGKYALKEEPVRKGTVLERLGISSEFKGVDKFLAGLKAFYGLFWAGVFLIGTGICMVFQVSDETWVKYWKIHLIIWLLWGTFFTVWITVGGIKNMFELFRDLARIERDDYDDGTVVDGRNLDEVMAEKTHKKISS